MADIDNVDPNEFIGLNNPDDGRSDPDKRFPRKEYVGVSGVNNIARGTRGKGSSSVAATNMCDHYFCHDSWVITWSKK